MIQRVNISGDILIWAIERAGFELDEFTERIPAVQDWIQGLKSPTVKQLQEFAKSVHIPFGYLFLQNPPREQLPIPFFRSSVSATQKLNLNSLDTILKIQQRQDWIKNYLIETEAGPLPFAGKFRDSRDIIEIANDIRRTLNLNEEWAGAFPTWWEAQNHLVEKIEDIGIFTVFNGVVGNNVNRKIPVSDCRGFVLYDTIAPFMFINNNDAKSAQMFTIAHELAHIWIGQSAAFELNIIKPVDDPTEILCNKIAAEFLLPESAFNPTWERNPSYSFLAKHFKVSELVAARRALDLGKIQKSQFFEFYNLHAESENNINHPQSSGGDFYATTRKRLGMRFAAHIHSAVKSGSLLYRDAYRLTDLRGDTFQTFFTAHL